jgi:hypothetical protein
MIAMRPVAVDVGDETDAAGVVLEDGIVQPLLPSVARSMCRSFSTPVDFAC